MKIKCIIIDDERLARDYIKNYISQIPQLELVAEYNSPLKAMDLLNSNQIDLMFIDIQMPDITGVDFVKGLKNPPEIIFTTAYQEYAVEGFNLNAMDYLLKPFSFDRFMQAVSKIIEKLENKSLISNLKNDIRHESVDGKDYLTIRADRKFYKINFDDIYYIEGQKAYVTFHTKKKRITALASLKDLEEILPNHDFMRVHKSFIVAIKYIETLEGNLLEVNDTKLPVGKSYKEYVNKIFGL